MLWTGVGVIGLDGANAPEVVVEVTVKTMVTTLAKFIFKLLNRNTNK